jgi:hypothetical protein
MFYWPGCDVAIRGTSPTFCESYFYGNGTYSDIPEMADSIYKGIQLFKNDSADLVGKYLQEMFVDTEGVHQQSIGKLNFVGCLVSRFKWITKSPNPTINKLNKHIFFVFLKK